MHPKYINSGDRFRSGPSYGRSRGQGGGGGGGFSRSYSKSYNHPRRRDILMQAGRLAAEYLVANGVLPPDSITNDSSLSDGRLSDFRGHRREAPSQPRRPAEARPWLGDSPDSSYGRRRFDDYDPRMSGGGRKRMGHHTRDYDTEFGRERKRNGWPARSGGGYSESFEEEENSPPGYRRDRRASYDKARSSALKGAGDEQPSKIEFVAETESELDDAGSKVSSNSRRKEARNEDDAEVNKGMDDVSHVTTSNVEAGEVNSRAASESEDVEKKVSLEADMGIKPDEVKEESKSKLGNYLSELCDFAKIPRKPRSSLRKQAFEQGPSAEASVKVEAPSADDSKITVDEVPADGSSREAPIAPVENLKHEDPACPPDLMETNEESLDSHSEVQQMTECLGSSVVPVDETIPDNSTDISQVEEIIMETRLPPSGTPQINEYTQLDSVRAVQPSLTDMQPEGEQMIKEISQLKPVGSVPVAKVDPHSRMEMEEEKQNQPASFKICDLNLIEGPEITEIPDNPVQENYHVAARPLEGDGKVIPIIDLEDDSLEVNNSDASNSKNEVMYPELGNVYSHTSHADDIPVLTISDYLGADMPCSPVQTDLNNLQAGMTLNASEGFPVVDDSIYGSLGDIGFMEVWDQPAHDYEKFF